jgi:hypothetical protein
VPAASASCHPAGTAFTPPAFSPAPAQIVYNQTAAVKDPGVEQAHGRLDPTELHTAMAAPPSVDNDGTAHALPASQLERSSFQPCSYALLPKAEAEPELPPLPSPVKQGDVSPLPVCPQPAATEPAAAQSDAFLHSSSYGRPRPPITPAPSMVETGADEPGADAGPGGAGIAAARAALLRHLATVAEQQQQQQLLHQSGMSVAAYGDDSAGKAASGAADESRVEAAQAEVADVAMDVQKALPQPGSMGRQTAMGEAGGAAAPAVPVPVFGQQAAAGMTPCAGSRHRRTFESADNGGAGEGGRVADVGHGGQPVLEPPGSVPALLSRGSRSGWLRERVLRRRGDDMGWGKRHAVCACCYLSELNLIYQVADCWHMCAVVRGV